MNINEIVLSIVKRPSFNLLAFQAFTFAVMTIAGAIGAFQFAPFWGIDGVSVFYFIGYCYLATAVLIYTSIIFVIGCILKKLHSLLFHKYLLITNFILFYIIYSIFICQNHTLINATTAGDAYAWAFVFGVIFLINGIIYFAVPLYGIILIIEQIRKIRIEPPQYCKTPIRFWAVVIPTTVYICIIIYIFFELFT